MQYISMATRKVRVTARFDDIPDDDAMGTGRQNRKPVKSAQEEMEELVYSKRCQLVKLANSSNYSKFMEFLRDNGHILCKMDDYGKECIRRTCQRAWENASQSTFEDLAVFDRLFGPHIDVSHSKRIPVMGSRSEHLEAKLTLEEEIANRSRGSYYAMWVFITDPEVQSKLKGRTDLYDSVKYLIDRAKANNEAVSPLFKRYEPSDEETYAMVLGLMKA